MPRLDARLLILALPVTLVPMAAAQPTLEDFPVDAVMPKRVTGATAFLEQYPEYDGRDVIVAIFDTGVDPGAAGLLTTPDGRPKIVDLVDASGSGDVNTTTIRTVEDGILKGLSGRDLTIPESWPNPDGEFRVGLKHGYDLFPAGLTRRMRTERRQDWDEAQRPRLAAAKLAIIEWDAENAKPTKEQLEEREDLVARYDALESMQGSYSDPGPIYDCVVWFDGEHWRAVIDTDEDGDLGDEKAMTNFRTEREYATFGERDLLNFAVNIYDEGDTLSIVADAGAHGTHVAGIVAAYHEDQPELNGVAPGAQIVGVKIGDTRLGSSSVNTGTTRGLITVLENDVDIINMSYGGPDAFPDEYRVNDLLESIVNDHGVIFVSSAGNSGPALSSVGSPGGTTTALIGVGAALTPEMMAAQYSLREPGEELSFPWSSRGPTLDGDLGVDITAPGGAIAPVPTWSLQKSMQMNGTSMSSPNAAGSIALMLSGLKAEGADYSPHSIKRSIMNTARLIEGTEIFAQGAGMIQIPAAYEHALAHRYASDNKIQYEVVVGEDRGVYLREPFENNEPRDVRVSVSPEFHRDADNRAKVAFETRVSFEASADWIDAPEFMMLTHGGRSFDIRVDPTSLPHGAHYGEVKGYDSQDPTRGALFRVPVTVIRTQTPASDGVAGAATWERTLSFKTGELKKFFVEVPAGATWADLEIERRDADTERVMVAHLVQLTEDNAFTNTEAKFWFRFDDHEKLSRSLALTGARTLEVALAQNWSSLGDGLFDVTVRFHGITPTDPSVAMHGGVPMHRVDVTSTLGDQRISPSASLTHLARSSRPSDRTIRPLSAQRDELPDSKRVYEMVLTYPLEMPQDGEVVLNPAISELPHAWEIFESQLYYVYDKNDQIVSIGAGSRDTVTLDEGSYTLKLHVRHDDPDMLSSVESMPIVYSHKLKSPVSVRASRTPGASLAGRSFGTLDLEQGHTSVVYLQTPAKMPDLAEPGDVLTGTIRFGEADRNGGAGRRPGGWPLSLAVVANAADFDDTPEASDAKDDEPEKSAEEKLAEAILDARLASLKGLTGEGDAEAFDALAETILAENPGHLPTLMVMLDRAEGLDDEIKADAVFGVTERIIDPIDQTALAAHFGAKKHDDTPEAKKLHEEMTEQRDALVASWKARASVELDAAKEAEPGEAREEALTAYDDAMDELAKWTDAEGDDYFDLRLARIRLDGRLGKALAMVTSSIDEKPLDRGRYETRVELLEELGWDEWASYERSRMLSRFPEVSRPF